MIKITKGQRLDLLMHLKDGVGRPIALTPYTITGVLKRNTTSGATLVEFDIDITDSAAGEFQCSILAVDTTDLPEGTHIGVIRIVRTSDSALIGDNVFEIKVQRGIDF
jgi:hypothetical protein